MVILITDAGLHSDDWTAGFVPPEGVGAGGTSLPGLDLTPPLSAQGREQVLACLDRLGMIRIRLRDFGDAQALDLARWLRASGYGGRLRAQGAVLARAWPLVLRSGFSEVALTLDQVRRQPPEHWTFSPVAGRCGVPFFPQPA